MSGAELSFEEAFESEYFGVVETTMDGVIIDANPFFIELLGYPTEELYKLDIYSLTPNCWTVFENSIIIKEAVPNGFAVYEKELIDKYNQLHAIEVTLRIERNRHKIWAIVKQLPQLSEKYRQIKVHALQNIAH